MSALNICCLGAAQDHEDARLSDELLIRHLFSHLPEPVVDIDDPDIWTVRAIDGRIQDTDEFCYAVRCFVSGFVIQDPHPFEHVFAMYRGGTTEEVKAAVHAIEEMDSVPRKILQEETRECLGQLAIQDRRADIVEWCLKEEGGLRFEAGFQREANRVKEDEDPELYGILDECCFSSSAWNHHWRASQQARDLNGINSNRVARR